VEIVMQVFELAGSSCWKLRDNVTAYDAMYVALAEALDAPIVTCDTPLAKAPGHRAHIEVIE
jgi:predicted nucleic acid-binding protein